jgi:hypothetical protein
MLSDGLVSAPAETSLPRPDAAPSDYAKTGDITKPLQGSCICCVGNNLGGASQMRGRQYQLDRDPRAATSRPIFPSSVTPIPFSAVLCKAASEAEGRS